MDSFANIDQQQNHDSKFRCIIGIDWSGADISYGVAQSFNGSSVDLLHHAHDNREVWDRKSLQSFLINKLNSSVSTLVLVDSGFGFPSGTERRLFGVSTWRKLVAKASQLLKVHQSPDNVARHLNEINNANAFKLSGESVDPTFFSSTGVKYYRFVEQYIPQAISQFYFGDGVRVGGHTITFLAFLDQLFEARQAGECSFAVWPQETEDISGNSNIIAETYPVLFSDENYVFGFTEADVDWKKFPRLLYRNRMKPGSPYSEIWSRLTCDERNAFDIVRKNKGEDVKISICTAALNRLIKSSDFPGGELPKSKSSFTKKRDESECKIIRNRNSIETRCRDGIHNRLDSNKVDAFKMVHWAREMNNSGKLKSAFELLEMKDRELARKTWKIEGWILGVF